LSIYEAAGDVDGYTKLDNVHEEQRTTAKVIQRTLLLVLPMVFTSFILGTLAEFEQNIYLYSVFTLVNGILGAVIFSFHTSANATVRAKIKGFFCRKQNSN
jgi:ABC-type transport system involved in cytochrome c biogenesis permease component